MVTRTVLFGSELGTGLGHAEKLLVIARGLASRSYRPVFAVREPAEASPLLGEGFAVLQAPFLKVQRRRPEELPASMAGVLAAFGLDKEPVVAAGVHAWRSLLRELRPALVVADYSPLLCLAAETMVPAVVVGSGFCVPPPELEGFPALVPHALARLTEDRVRCAIEAVQPGGPLPSRALPSRLAGAAHFVLCMPELDPYAAVRRTVAVGPLEVTAEEPAWDGRADLFAYLTAEDPATATILGGIGQAGVRTTAFVRELHGLGEPLPGASNIQYLQRPPPFDEVVRSARVIVHHGGLGTAQKALLAGRFQVMVPRHLEQALNAENVARMGAGLRLPRRSSPEAIADRLQALVRGPEAPFERARALADVLRRRFGPGALGQVLEACEAHVHRPADGSGGSGRSLAEHAPEGASVKTQRARG